MIFVETERGQGGRARRTQCLLNVRRSEPTPASRRDRRKAPRSSGAARSGTDGYDASRWPELKQRFAELFATRDRDAWCALLEGTDACFAPVLTPEEAARHPHIVDRGIYSQREGMLQANPAPRFSGPRAVPGPVPRRGEHADEILRAAGLSIAEIESLRAGGVVS